MPLSPLTPLTTIKDNDDAHDVNYDNSGADDSNIVPDVVDGKSSIASSFDDPRDDGNDTGYMEFLSVIAADPASAAGASTPTNSVDDAVRDAIRGEEESVASDVRLEISDDDDDCRCACFWSGPILGMLRGPRADVIHPA